MSLWIVTKHHALQTKIILIEKASKHGKKKKQNKTKQNKKQTNKQNKKSKPNTGKRNMNFGCRGIFGSTLGDNGEEETVNKIKILRKEWITEFPSHSKAKVHGLRVL